MSPATLYREGTDLDDLLAGLDQQYPGRVRVVSIAHPREGGVLGFFAKQRVGVHYRLTDGSGEIYDVPAYDASADDAPAGEVPGGDGSVGDLASAPSGTPPQFAEVLAQLAARKSPPVDEGRMIPVDTIEFSTTTAPADEVPDDTPTPTSTLKVSRAYAQIQARAEAAAARLAADLAADPASGFRPAPLPELVPAQHSAASASPKPRERTTLSGPSVQSLVQWPTEGRRTPRAVPTFTPLSTDEPVDRSEPQPVTWPNADAPAAAPRTSALNWNIAAAEPAPPAATPTPAPEPAPGTPALQRQLCCLGIDPGLVPGDATHAFAAIDTIVAALPAAPTPPTAPGQVLVVAGRAREAQVAADTLTAAAPIDVVWYYGCPGRADQQTIASAEQVADIVANTRQRATGPVLIVVGTDGSSWTSRAREVIEAADADALWAVVDATVKSEDAQAGLRRLGEVDAIIVSAAEYSSSPATVWGLDKPVALLDGRPATPAAWAVLLMGKLTEMERTCSDARY